jgi:transcriptional regulator with XRE-family HTH domain
MSQYDTCGQRMASRLSELQLSPGDVAEKVKIQIRPGDQGRQLSVAAYQMYEQDELDPSVKTIEQIAEVLRVPPGWLAFGNGSSTPTNLSQNDAIH